MIDSKIAEFENFSRDRILMSWICGAMGAWFYTFLVCDQQYQPNPLVNREKNLEWNFNNSFAVSNSPYTNAQSTAYGLLKSFVNSKYPTANNFEQAILIRLLEVKIAATTCYLDELQKLNDIYKFFQTLNLDVIDRTVLSTANIETWQHVKTHKDWIFFEDNSIKWLAKLNIAFPEEKIWIPRLLCFYKKIEQWRTQTDTATTQTIINRVANFNLQTPADEYLYENNIIQKNNFKTVDIYNLVFNQNLNEVIEIFPNFEFQQNHRFLLDVAKNDQLHILKLFDLDPAMNLKLSDDSSDMMRIFYNSDYVKKLRHTYKA